SQTDVAESSSTVEEISFYSVGDTVKVGDAEYTLTGVELSDERNQFDETNPAEVVKISYTVKNNSDSDLPVGADVDVYGSDDKKAESYPNENTMGSVAPGKQMDCVQHFGINGTGEIEIHFAPLISFEDAAIYKATI
ncbi:MAG TPA: phage immunity protein, partial [Flavobacteriaceae bacterium]|nr:phage immunity protein [Flavobacteriaceae bacterium]